MRHRGGAEPGGDRGGRPRRRERRSSSSWPRSRDAVRGVLEEGREALREAGDVPPGPPGPRRPIHPRRPSSGWLHAMSATTRVPAVTSTPTATPLSMPPVLLPPPHPLTTLPARAGGGRRVRQQSITPSKAGAQLRRRTRGGLGASRARRVGGFRPRNTRRGRGGRRRVRGADGRRRRTRPCGSRTPVSPPASTSRRPPRPSSSQVLERRPPGGPEPARGSGSRTDRTADTVTVDGTDPGCVRSRSAVVVGRCSG